MKKPIMVAAALLVASAAQQAKAQGIGGVTAASKGVNNGISMPALNNFPGSAPAPDSGGPAMAPPGSGPSLQVMPQPGQMQPGPMQAGGPTQSMQPQAPAQPVYTGPPMTPAQYAQMAKDLPLFEAAYLGHNWSARHSVTKGAKVNSADWQYGLSPLAWASLYGHLGTVKYLLSAGADCNAASRPGTPLLLATGRSAARPVADAPSELTLATTLYSPGGGVTPLIAACAHGYNLTVRALLQHGADANKAMPGQLTPLMMDAFAGNVPALAALVGRGARVNAADYTGATALQYAAVEGNTAAARYLLAHGADPTVQGGKLHLGSATVARMLGHNDTARIIEKAAKTWKPVPQVNPAPAVKHTPVADEVTILN